VIFLDTGFVFALVYRRDANHKRVRAVMDEYRGLDLRRLVLTTNHVVEETITLVRSSVHRDAGVAHDIAVDVGRQLFAGVFGQIHHATPEEERAAFEYLARHRDKKYSLTDCLSFVVMEKHGIREALAVDEDFTHRFIARPGPLPRPR
jgi:predicted nucleic acid-binding protein